MPDVMIGVSARPFSKSLSSHVQQMGRVMRPCEGKESALWLCHSGNYLRFRDEWDELYSDGVQELSQEGEKAKKEPSDREKQDSKCPKCGFLWPKGTDTCPACGHVRLRLSQIAAVAGHLEELGGGVRVQKDEKQNFYSELIWIAQSKGYNPNWAKHKFREKFGVWPQGLSEDPKTPSQKTMNWVRSRNIAWAKANRR